MSSIVADIQDAPPAVEVDARNALRPTPEFVSTEPAEPEVLAQFAADATIRAARGYALLTVQRSDDGQHFMLLGQHSENEQRIQIGEPGGRPDLSLGNLAAPSGVSPEDVYDYMLEWSQGEASLINWLQQLRAEVGDDELRLVIWDTTGFDIPWELFYVPGAEDPQRREGPLGALVAVSRRVAAHQGADNGSPYADHICRGRLLAFVDDTMLADRQFLERYSAGEINLPGELLDQLDQAVDPLGLVYIACHGTYADELPKLRLGDLRYFQINRYPLTALTRSRAVVFLNACHAGRLLWDFRINREASGFASAFLRKGADAVIGPTGFVETGLAGRIAAGLLDQVARQPDQALASALTRIRAQIAQRVVGNLKPTEADLKELAYTFMYVCYGNPYATIELSAGDGQ
jgi:CHAT domain-containing protein